MGSFTETSRKRTALLILPLLPEKIVTGTRISKISAILPPRQGDAHHPDRLKDTSRHLVFPYRPRGSMALSHRIYSRSFHNG